MIREVAVEMALARLRDQGVAPAGRPGVEVFYVSSGPRYDVVFWLGEEEFRVSVPAAEVERDADHLLRQAAAGPRTGAQRVQERGAGGDIGALRLIALVLPASQRADWLEEQRGYIADLPRRRKRWGWIIAQTVAMPKYAYAVRTGREAEAA